MKEELSYTPVQELPQPLARLVANPRVTVRRPGAPLKGGKCVVYWMQHAQRALDNPALDLAIELGNELNLPVVAFFSAISNYPGANLRHYVFLNEGFADIQQDLEERNVSFVLRRPPDNVLERFLEDVGAAMVIGDENHCREPERWRKVLAHRISLPFWTVDADVVVPSGLFPRRFFALHHFKPKLYAELPKYMVPMPIIRAKKSWDRPPSMDSFPVHEDVTRGWTKLDRSVGPVDTFHGGTHAALVRLKKFVDHGLATYPEQRNHPETDGTSRMSPYLHYGHISPLTIALAVEDAYKSGAVPQAARDSFLSELIGWRELSVNFVRYDPNYDSIECADSWAQQSLLEHSRDPRAHIYTLEQLERAETYDELWNAAQIQMNRFGWMHNRLRMYWAKKILEWTPTPAIGYGYAVQLNDKYFVDGRDPNGYAGIAWSMVGKHDRPWFDRPIFGKVRYMSGASTGKKFNSKRYISDVTGVNQEPGLFK